MKYNMIENPYSLLELSQVLDDCFSKALSGLAVVMNICGMLLVLLDILVVYILTRPEYKREDNAPLLAEEVPSI